MFFYKPSFIPSSVVVIGAGGTGSRLMPMLSQFLKTITWLQNPTIYIIDHDIVEDKNLTRQNFIKLDLNKPKAVVVADRYSKAFDINIKPIVTKVVPYVHAKHKVVLEEPEIVALPHGLSLDTLRNSIVILCVDSAQGRRDILTHLMYSGNRNLLIIDSGNENDYGQVLLYNDAVFKANAYTPETAKGITLDGGLIPFDVQVPLIPFPSDFYKDMVDVESKSCAELDQTLAINATMATAIMGIVQNFIYGKPVAYHRVNISLSHGSIPEYMTYNYLYKSIFEATSLYRTLTTNVDRVFTEIITKMKEFNHGKEPKETSKKGSKKVKQEEVINSLAELANMEEVIQATTTAPAQL